MAERFTLEDLASMLERLCPSATIQLHDSRVRVVTADAPFDARMMGCDAGRMAVSFSSPFLTVEAFEDRFPLTRLLAGVASTCNVRVVVEGERIVFESRVVPDDIASDQLEQVLRWHLAEFCAVVQAWRRRLGLAPEAPPAEAATTLRELVRTTPITPQKALLVAAVGFGIAGADGKIAPTEAARLHAWLTEVPSFAALDRRRVIAAIATLVGASARTLLEARRHLDMRERLLAWALANDMAHADGFTSPDEQRYLTSVASVFELSLDEMQPLINEAHERAVRHETPVPPAITH